MKYLLQHETSDIFNKIDDNLRFFVNGMPTPDSINENDSLSTIGYNDIPVLQSLASSSVENSTETATSGNSSKQIETPGSSQRKEIPGEYDETPRKKKKKNCAINSQLTDEFLEEALQCLKKPSNVKKVEDVHEAFANYLALEMRKLNEGDSQELRVKIMHLIFEKMQSSNQ